MKIRKAIALAALSLALAAPAQAATHIECGRISGVFYDQQAKEYQAEAVFKSGDGFVFRLGVEGSENELVTEALEHLLVGNIAELTVDDMGTANVEDDQVIGANF